MPAKSPERRKARAQLANSVQRFGKDDPRTVAARQRFHETMVEEVVASLPPLTDPQRRRLARLILATTPQPPTGATAH